jgi:hypothetical protein
VCEPLSKVVDENGTFVGCVIHKHTDARTGGTIFPEKGEPFWGCLECIEKALGAGLTVRRFGHEQVKGEDVESTVERTGKVHPNYAPPPPPLRGPETQS